MATNTMGLRDAYTQTLDIDIYPKGLDGKDGISIVAIKINEQNHLITTMSDGTVLDSGKIHMEAGNFDIRIVDTLPISGISISTIYCVATADPTEDNRYDEYAYIENRWEKIGSATIDLDKYYTKDEIDNIKSDLEDLVQKTKEDLELELEHHTNAETIKTTSAQSNDTYYLLGTEHSKGARQTEVINSGLKYVKGTVEEKGTLYVEEEQVVTNLYFDIH